MFSPASTWINTCKARSAFTLVELSIVIVIIGLLVGGVVAGKNIVKAAQIRNVLNEVNQITAAVTAFKLQYNALPGDIRNFSSYYPSCVVDPNSGSNTCNGDGNGIVQYWAPSGGMEGLRAHQHLLLTGLYPDQGLSNPGLVYIANTLEAVPGYNVPKTPMGGGYTIGSTYGGRGWGLWVGGRSTNWTTSGNLFTHSEAYNIDKKLDDGFPNAGKIISWGDNASCQTPLVYDLTNTVADCALEFRGFHQ